jgi:signal transduction histidine kinase
MRRVGSILSRILWLHAAALAAVAIAMPLATYLLLETTANGFENQTLRAHAESLATYLRAEPNGQFRLDLPPDLRTFYLHGFDGFAYSIVDHSGRVLFSSLKGGGQLPGGSATGTAPYYFQHSLGRAIYYGASFPITRAGQTIRIEVGQDLEHPDVIIDDIVAGYLAHVAWFTFPILLLLLIIDVLIVRRALAPVMRASDLARAIDPGRIDIRLPIAGVPAEVRPLVLAVNQALDRLEEGFRAQREFTADAAHELRTPLAVLRARIDSLADHSTASALRSDLENMTHVVNQLLAVAELEANTAGAMETVDLHGICSEVAASLAPIAIAQKKDIALTGTEAPVLVRGNAPMLHRAIRNLAENALRHTPEGTSVEIGVSSDGAVTVSDEGPGVPPAERELIFRRFWRRDRARADGAGLGLAIVSRIVEAHAGKVEVTNRATGGAIFAMRLGAPPAQTVMARE